MPLDMLHADEDFPGSPATQNAFAIDPSGQPYDVDTGPEEDESRDDGDQGMTDDEYVAALESAERLALDAQMHIADERAEAIDYYFRRPFGNEEPGRSAVVTSDVQDEVEGMMPGILKPFVSSNDVVKFLPVSADDVKQADQETDYVNHVLMQKNQGFNVIYTWVKDGLWQKNGYVKYFWDTIQRVRIEHYEGLDPMQLQLIEMDERVEIIKLRQRETGSAPAPEVMQGMAGPTMLYDVTVRKRTGYGCARVLNVPQEEMVIAHSATDVNPKRAPFVEHRRMITISDLREMGFDVDEEISDMDDGDLRSSPEYQARRVDEPGMDMHSAGQGPSREVLVREMYPLIDRDGDGIAERRRVFMVGHEILRYAETGELADEEVEEPPFCGWTPYIIPHRHHGMSVADQTMGDPAHQLDARAPGARQRVHDQQQPHVRVVEGGSR
jgi:hypothetical protein